MSKLPKWLPAAVKEHAEQLLLLGEGLNTAKPLLLRLVSYPEMQKVWAVLSASTDNPQKLITFLDYVRLHSALWGNPTDPIKAPSDKVQRTAFKKVFKLSAQLIETLRTLSPHQDAQDGWSLMEAALRRVEFDVIHQTPSKDFLEIKQLQQKLNLLQHNLPVVNFIEVINRVAEIASQAPDDTLPKRRHSAKARYNLLSLGLKDHLKHYFHLETADTLIASTVNTAFDYADGGISADDVRKLKR